MVDFYLPSNWRVSLLQKFEFAVLVVGFEKLGLELDDRGRTTKNAYCRIYSLWVHPPSATAQFCCMHVLGYRWNVYGCTWSANSTAFQYVRTILEIFCLDLFLPTLQNSKFPLFPCLFVYENLVPTIESNGSIPTFRWFSFYSIGRTNRFYDAIRIFSSSIARLTVTKSSQN
jgi:hypothetical protein